MARIQHCLETRKEDPYEALRLADALLSGPQLPEGPRLGAIMCRAEGLMVIGEGDAARETIGQALLLMDSPRVPAQQRFPALMNFGGMLQSLGRNLGTGRRAGRPVPGAGGSATCHCAGLDRDRRKQAHALVRVAPSPATQVDAGDGAEPGRRAGHGG